MKIGIIGSGTVSQTLAVGLVHHGHQVAVGTRDPSKLAEWKSKNPTVSVTSMRDAAAFGEVCFLAVKGNAAQEAVAGCADALAGKVVLDTTNPIADVPPKDGVLSYFTSMNDSLMERLQTAFPKVHFVKAFNSVGAPRMVNPTYAGGKPSMFICGNDADAKKVAADIVSALGWEVEDMGTAVAARAIEPLCVLWCIPGMRSGQWTHAFKLLKA